MWYRAWESIRAGSWPYSCPTITARSGEPSKQKVIESPEVVQLSLVERLGVRQSAFTVVRADELSGKHLGGQILLECPSPFFSRLPVACESHGRPLGVAVKAA
jgi:hypothetical protein